MQETDYTPEHNRPAHPTVVADRSLHCVVHDCASAGKSSQLMTAPTAGIPPELFARLAHPTVRLSGSIDEAAAALFLSQVLPVLDVPGSIVVELFGSGGYAEVGRRLAQEVRLLRQAHNRDMRFLGKTLVASAAVTIMAGFPRDRRWLTRLSTPRQWLLTAPSR